MDRQIKDLAAIKQIALDWNAGWNKGNVEALLALYVDNPILLPQGQPAITEKVAIRPLYQSVFKEYIIKGEGEVVAMETSGDLGYFWINYTLTATSKASGDRSTSKGKSLFVVRRQSDNSWKIALLMDNSDEDA